MMETRGVQCKKQIELRIKRTWKQQEGNQVAHRKFGRKSHFAEEVDTCKLITRFVYWTFKFFWGIQNELSSALLH